MTIEICIPLVAGGRSIPRAAGRVMRAIAGSAAVGAAVAIGACDGMQQAMPPSEAGAPVAAERCRAPEFRAFDFWLGEWEVRNPDGEVVGHNEIRRVAGGCGLLESWQGATGGAGRSSLPLDAADQGARTSSGPSSSRTRSGGGGRVVRRSAAWCEGSLPTILSTSSLEPGRSGRAESDL